MSHESDSLRPASRVLRPFVQLTPVAAALLAAVALFTLIGWAIDVPWMRGGGPHGGMGPKAAIGFLIAATSLWYLRNPGTPRWQSVLGMVLAALLGLFGGLMLADRLFGWHSGLGVLLFPEAERRAFPNAQGGLALNTGISFVVCAVAIMLLDTGRRHRGVLVSELLATATFCMSFLALIAFAYGVEGLMSLPPFAGMAALTAVELVILSVAIFFARPDRGFAVLIAGDNASGVFTRRLLPAALLVPVALGWVLLDGLRTTLLDLETGIAVFVLAIIGVFVTLVARSATAVRASDVEREKLLQREQRARTEAEAANRAKSEFLASISHELRTPLNAIAGYAEIMELGIRGPVTVQQSEDLGRIRRSQQHLLSLINDILNYARIETGHVEYHVAETPIDPVLREAASLMEPQMRVKGIAFEYIPCEFPVQVWADTDKLRQIVLNLLSNATKFTESRGHVTLACRVLHVNVGGVGGAVTTGEALVSGSGNGASGEEWQQPHAVSRRTPVDSGMDVVTVSVADTGRGIPPDKLEEIFEPFVQLDRSLTRNVEGTGLGLAISRDLARGMGGELRAKSEVGQGSVFTLVLRLASPVVVGAAGS